MFWKDFCGVWLGFTGWRGAVRIPPKIDKREMPAVI